jgi:hypothetical protein
VKHYNLQQEKLLTGGLDSAGMASNWHRTCCIRCGQTTFLLPTPSFSDISGSQSMEIHKDRLEIPWEIPSGKRLHNYGKSPFLMGKLTINHHFQ